MNLGESQRGIVLKKILLPLMIVAVVLAAGFILYRLFLYKPEYRGASDQFMASVTSNDPGASYNLLTKALKQEKTEDEWSKELNASFEGYTGSPEYSGASKIGDPKKIYGEAGAYRVSYKITYKNKSYVMDLVMRREDGLWKVSEYRSYVP